MDKNEELKRAVLRTLIVLNVGFIYIIFIYFFQIVCLRK